MFDEKRVGAIARAALENILLPSRKNLAVLESHEKMPGELVTSADVESQRFIHSELEALCPGAQFLGEELQDGRSPDLNALAGYEGLWIVDPLDGTSVYASGGLTFSVMIAFASRGIVRGAWIAAPRALENGEIGVSLAWAVEGRPAILDGNKVMLACDTDADGEGIVRTKFFSPEVREQLAAVVRSCKGQSSAGVDMLDLVAGRADYLMYSRTLPWDFAAPLLWGASAGVVARRLSGHAVSLKPGGTGLLCARTEADWRRAHADTIAKTSHADRICGELSADRSVRV